jgi:hypothetical protein
MRAESVLWPHSAHILENLKLQQSLVGPNVRKGVDSGGSIGVLRPTGIGASRPLASVPPKVPSPPGQRALSLAGGNRSSCPLSDLADASASLAGESLTPSNNPM